MKKETKQKRLFKDMSSNEKKVVLQELIKEARRDINSHETIKLSK